MTQPKAVDPILDAKDVSKHFGSVIALQGASLQVNSGEVVALMGANGAGKSTLIKILTGAISLDSGHVRIKGREHTVSSPAKARKSGLIPVYQEPSLIPDLDITDNLRLGDTPVEPFRQWVNELGLTSLDKSELIGNLPLASLRIIDLARALASAPDVLLLDEVTAALPTDLVERVLKVVRAQADSGSSVIYISHRFTEISELCDRATILRDGTTVGDVAIEPGVEDQIVELMLGETIKPRQRDPSAGHESRFDGQSIPRLRVSSLGAGPKLPDVSFDLHRGEVLGVVALEGQGQDELFEVLAGHRRGQSGTIEIDGEPALFSHPADAIRSGHTFVPGNRADALLMQQSVRDNIALPFSANLRNWGVIPKRKESASVANAIERLQIDTRAQGEVRRLSGGNQQKVTIGRWIATGVDTLLLFDPTRGIDVRTKAQIYALVRELAEQGASILFYTSELAEIKLACDRAVVIFGGRVADIIDASDADEQTLMRAAYGLTRQSKPEQAEVRS